MKVLKHIPRVTDSQVVFGARLGLDLQGCTLSVAAARIEDAVDAGFHGATNAGSPTQKQIKLAAHFGYDITALSRREGSAVINDLMTELNYEAIESEGLAPGVRVVNVYDKLGLSLLISSIQPDGAVYFRGGNGKRAWARNIRREGQASGTSLRSTVQRRSG